MVHERPENFFVDAIYTGDDIAIGAMLQVAEAHGKLTESHNFTGGPNGRQFRIIIGLAVMLDKGFLTPPDFGPQAFNMLLMDIGAFENAGVKMRMAPVFKG